MKWQDGAAHGRVSIKKIQRTHVNAIAALHDEFETYLRSLDPKRPKDTPTRFRQRLLRDGFGPRAAFGGFVAVQDGSILGYVLYHPGYDPDEMHGRVLYVIDLFVTERSRQHGVGSQLMQKVVEASRDGGGIDVYFGVWTKNPGAKVFYHRIGASHNPELRFYHFKEGGSVPKKGGLAPTIEPPERIGKPIVSKTRPRHRDLR
jgi:GNAT superfamily N-acetyltransferase